MSTKEQQETESEGDILTLEEVEPPRLYKVLLHNDDYTTMEFVIHILMKHFGKNRESAKQIMLEIHERGIGLCGVFTFEVAESKVEKVLRESKKEGFPLACTYESD